MIVTYIMTLLAVCGLAVGSLALLRVARERGLLFGGAFNPVSPIRVVGRQAVGTGATLMLVEVDQTRMLIGVSRNGMTMLDDGRRVILPAPGSTQSARNPVEPRHDFAFDGGATSFHAILRRAGSGS